MTTSDHHFIQHGLVAVRHADIARLQALLADERSRELVDEWAWELTGDNATETLIDATARLECARLLLQHGAKSTAQGSGLTLVHMLLHRGVVDVAELFIRAGAPVDGVTEWGTTPLHDTLKSAPLTRLLCERGADAKRAPIELATPEVAEVLREFGAISQSNH